MIETVVVIGLLSMIATLAVFVSLETYRGNTMRSTRDLLISNLQHARAQSMNNVCIGNCGTPADGKPHGVHIETNASGFITQFIVYQGTTTTYTQSDPLNMVVNVNDTISQAQKVTGIQDVYFDQLSGNAHPTGVITITDGITTSSIQIGTEGELSWTN